MRHYLLSTYIKKSNKSSKKFVLHSQTNVTNKKVRYHWLIFREAFRKSLKCLSLIVDQINQALRCRRFISV